MSLQRSIPLSFASFASLLLCAGIVSAQGAAPRPKQYAPDPNLVSKYWPNERSTKEFYKSVYNVLRGRVDWNDQPNSTLAGGLSPKAVIDNWFREKLVREFTMSQNWGKLPELRAALLKELKTASSPQASAYLKKEVLRLMTLFSQERLGLHPAVRYNAMLVVGDLNDFEAGSRDGERRVLFPDPMAAGFDVLLAEFNSAGQLDAVKVAALVGLLRHAKLNNARIPARRLENGKRLLAVKAMLDLVKADAPPTRSAAGHAWMQRRGIEIMAAYGAVGEIAQVNAALEQIVADDAKPMSLRCTAAEALSRWQPDSQTRFDPQALSASLGRLGGKALLNELELIGKIQESDKLKEQLRELIADTSTVMTAATAMSSGGGGEMSEMMMRGSVYGNDDSEDEGDGGAMMDMAAFFGTGGEGMSAMMGGDPLLDDSPEDPRVTRSRRRLKHQLACVQAGLAGILRAPITDPQKESVNTVITAIDEAYKTTDPEGSDLPALEKSIKKGLGALAFLMPAEALPDSPLGDALSPSEPGAPAPGASVPGGPSDPVGPAPGAPVPGAPATVGAPQPGAPAPAVPAGPAVPAAPGPPNPGVPVPDGAPAPGS